jgi:hypothetical protein
MHLRCVARNSEKLDQRRSNFFYITYINQFVLHRKHNISPLCSQELWKTRPEAVRVSAICMFSPTDPVFTCSTQSQLTADARESHARSIHSSFPRNRHNLTLAEMLHTAAWWQLNAQGSCPHIQSSWFNFRSYHIFWEAVALDRGPLSLVSTIEDLLGTQISGSGLEIREYGSRHPSRWPRDTLAIVGINFSDK